MSGSVTTGPAGTTPSLLERDPAAWYRELRAWERRGDGVPDEPLAWEPLEAGPFAQDAQAAREHGERCS